MKYVIAEYSAEKESLLRRFLRKTGVYNKYEIYDIKNFETEGYIVTLPFLQEEIENIDQCKSYIEKMTDNIKTQYGEAEYCLPYELRAVYGRTGFYTSVLAACEIFMAIKEKKDMKYVKTVIAGKDIKALITLLDGIYDGLNSLAVLTKTDKLLDDKARDIYSETGLDVIFVTGVKNPVFMDADIVINCGIDLTGSINAIKKDALYITTGEDTYIKEERKDLNVISLDKIKTTEGLFDTAYIEAVLCAKNYGYRNFINSRYYKDKAQRAHTVLKEVLLIDIC